MIKGPTCFRNILIFDGRRVHHQNTDVAVQGMRCLRGGKEFALTRWFVRQPDRVLIMSILISHQPVRPTVYDGRAAD